jgi:iron complex outermembrane receptor protein
MRAAVLVTAICLSIVGLSFAADADAAMRRSVNIPAQGLGPALQTLAKDRDFQILYRSEVVGDLLTQGATGDLTPAQALEQLLRGTGLTYRYLDEKTVTIVPVAKQSSTSTSDAQVLSAAERVLSSAETPDPAAAQKAGFWDRFRLAQNEPSSPSDNSSSRDETPSQNSSKNSDQQNLEEIIVTAQKREERLHNVPISITVLNGTALERSSLDGVTDALNRIPGVVASMGAEGEGTQIGIRGVGAAGPLLNGSSPNAYYLDSVPFGLVRSGVAPNATIYDLQRIEVLRGPQGTLYGASAENGVVRVLTNDANLDAFELKARTTLSTTEDGSGNYRGDVAVNVPIIEGKLAVRGLVGYDDESGWIDATFKKNANASREKTYRLKVNAQPTDALSIGLSLWRSRNHADSPSTADDLGQADHTLPDPVDIGYDTYGLKVGYDFSHVTLSSMTSYLDYDNQFVLDLAGFGFPGFTVLADTPAHMFSQEVLVSSKDSGSLWRWSAGGFYRNASDRLFQTSPVVMFKDDSESYAVFGELSRRFFGRKFEWTLGLRHFHDDVATTKLDPTPPPFSTPDSFNSTTPRAVLTWYPSEDVMVYGSYSEGFRSGMPQYYSISESHPEVPPLKPDKLHNYEIGAKAQFLDRRISLDGAIYYIDWQDVQQALLVPFGGVQINALVNGGSASGPGVDLSVTASPAAGLDFGVAMSWNDLTFDSDVISNGAVLFNGGERLNYSSKYTGSAYLEYSFPIGVSGFRGQFSVSANHTSKQNNRGAGYLALGNDLTFARASFAINSPNHWSATLFGDNLNNEDGATPAVYPVPYWYPRPRPRTVGLQFEYHL